MVELKLPGTVRIHLVVNISQIRKYKEQVPGQKKQPAPLVIIEREKEYKVEKIMNVMNHSIPLSHYLFFFSFSFSLIM